MKSSDYATFLDEVLAAIRDRARAGTGRQRQIVPMARELAEWAIGEDVETVLLDGLKPFVRGRRAFLAGRVARRDAVACAVHAMTEYGLRVSRAAEHAGVPAGDVTAVARVAKAAGRSLEDLGRSASDRIRAAAELALENLIVVLDQRAVEDLFLPAIEALRVKAGGKGGTFTEAYGLCFGTRRDVEQTGSEVRRIFYVNRIITQLRARATASEVFPNERSEAVHLRLARHLFEHLDLIGDYHTHPYRTVERLREVKGWEPSRDDIQQFREWSTAKREDGHGPRFFLIAAMARGKRAERIPRRKRDNVVQLVIDDVHVFLSAWRMSLGGDYDGKVLLRVPGLR